MPKIIHLFRHGLTDWNALRKMQGHTDIPLNEEGRQQALKLQTFFKQNPVELFATSDLSRAQETTKIANAKLQLPTETFSGLREAYLGALEGLTLAEAHERFGVEPWEKWTSINPAHYEFAFPEAESSRQAVTRFQQTLQIFCTEYSFKTAGVCTHGFILRRFLHSLRPDLTDPLPIPNCVVYTIHWDEKSNKFSFLL